jgi:hypothetical protein
MSEATTASAYALPTAAIAAPELNRPALKKYGLSRPDFNLKLPNLSTPKRVHKSMKSLW